MSQLNEQIALIITSHHVLDWVLDADAGELTVTFDGSARRAYDDLNTRDIVAGAGLTMDYSGDLILRGRPDDLDDLATRIDAHWGW